MMDGSIITAEKASSDLNSPSGPIRRLYETAHLDSLDSVLQEVRLHLRACNQSEVCIVVYELDGLQNGMMVIYHLPCSSTELSQNRGNPRRKM